LWNSAETDAKSKAAAAVKAVADKKAADTAKAAEPQNLNDIVPSTPIILTVKRAPVNLTAAVPDNGVLKRGAKADVKVTVQRVNGYATSHVSLPLPRGEGSAAPVIIPPDKTKDSPLGL
jgi:hypothetical protein